MTILLTRCEHGHSGLCYLLALNDYYFLKVIFFSDFYTFTTNSSKGRAYLPWGFFYEILILFIFTGCFHVIVFFTFTANSTEGRAFLPEAYCMGIYCMCIHLFYGYISIPTPFCIAQGHSAKAMFSQAIWHRCGRFYF